MAVSFNSQIHEGAVFRNADCCNYDRHNLLDEVLLNILSQRSGCDSENTFVRRIKDVEERIPHE